MECPQKKGPVEGIKQESVYGLSTKRVTVVKRWPWLLVQVRLYN